VVVPRLESAPRDDVDADAQKLLKILEQADVIKKGSAWLEIHEQVEIAAWTSLSPSDRAEHRDPMSPAPPRHTEDLRSAAAQPFQGQHVFGHPLRVSVRARNVPHRGTVRTRPSAAKIWYVPHAMDGGVTWYARRWEADYRHNLHAHTPAELEEYLTEAEAEH
jgi:hypothetical protein